MTAPNSRLLLGFVVMACLAGCGGGSNGGSTGGGGGTGGGGNPTTVTYTFTGAVPTAVATRIGTGSFTPASLQSGKLSIGVPSGTTKYSVAWVCPADARFTPPVNEEHVIEASTQDGTSLTWYCDDNGSTVTKGAATVQVDASAISGGALVYVSGDIGDNSGGTGLAWSSGTLNLSGQMLVGTYDVFVDVEDASRNILAVKILRNQTIPGALNGGNPVVFDSGDETTTQTLTVNNIPSGFSASTTFIDYLTADFGDGLMLNYPFSAQPNQYTAFPSGAIQSGDYYWFDAGAYGSQASTAGEYIGVEMDTSSNNPPTVMLPAPWSYHGPSAAAFPTFKFDYTGLSGMANVQYSAGLEWGQPAPGQVESYFPNEIAIIATANYQNGATTITVPDLSRLAGFLAPAPSGTRVFWYAEVEQGFPLLSSPVNGTWSVAGDDGTYTEP